MAAEVFANLAETTLASSYTSGGSSIAVTSATGFPTTGVFRVRLGNVGKTIYRVDSVSGTTFTGGAEANDANAAGGDTVKLVASRQVGERFIQTPDAGEIHGYAGVSGADRYGPLHKLTPLDQSGWTWLNQGSATVTQTSGVVLLSTPLAGATNVRARHTSQPATPYTITALVVPRIDRTNAHVVGLMFRESGSGELLAMQLLYTTRLYFRGNRYNSATSSNSEQGARTGDWISQGPFFMRIANNASTLTLSWSLDGVHFVTQHSESVGTFLTPDQVGFMVEASAGNDVAMSILSWVVT